MNIFVFCIGLLFFYLVGKLSDFIYDIIVKKNEK